MKATVCSSGSREERLGRPAAALGAGLLAAAVLAVGASSAGAATLKGTVKSGDRAIDRAPVKLYAAGADDRNPTQLGQDATDKNGRFKLRYEVPAGEGPLYATVGAKSSIRLAATLGATPIAGKVKINELTTAATGYAFAQFIGGRRIGGPAPGPQNAALMARNLVNPRTGELAGVIRNRINGSSTSTLQTFNSVANMLPRCARSASRCVRLFRLARTHDGRRPRNAMQAVANIAANPWQNVNRLAKLANSSPAPYQPALAPSEPPAAWTVALRFDGDGESLDGPGNIAFDANGNGYVANNYEYDPSGLTPVCGAENLPAFGPDGRYLPDAPFTGGGLSGAGYGVTVAPNGNIWVANFGFATPAPGCPEADQPPHDNVSEFTPDGNPLSPDTGYAVGGLNWPQGIVPDTQGTIWAANCNDGSVTRIPNGDPSLAENISGLGLDEAFDVAINQDGRAFVSGIESNNVAILEPDGTPTANSPLGSDELGTNRPMGVASDSKGNVWIANSGRVALPCPGPVTIGPGGGSVSMIGSDGEPVTGPGTTFTGGGLTIPWGISVDGDDNVWVANFAKKRISQFCGARTSKCPPGHETGDPISPNGSGYFFDGLVRVTAVQTDPSGNVWAANNWKQLPDFLGNPGGYEMVIFVGAAEPLRTPVIGTPEGLFG